MTSTITVQSGEFEAMETRPKRLENSCIWRKVDNQIIILSDEGRIIHTLNEVGTAVWPLLDGEHSIETIMKTITEQFEVDPETASADILTFLNKLVDLQLVECV